jgi:hypothetical protein
MFNMPQPPDAPREGSSVEVPLKLDGVRKEDFKNFLRVFLPMYVNQTMGIGSTSTHLL